MDRLPRVSESQGGSDVEDWFVEKLSDLITSAQEVAEDILMLQFTIVNAYLVGKPGGEFALVDTGITYCSDFILETVEKRFGKDARPRAIILTHGHFDHVGTVVALANQWDVDVYCHPLEIPYLTGKKDYPVPDPTVDDGLIAKLSPTFPHTGIDLSPRIAELPADGSVPGMEGWRWIHTPGHTEGHVSLFRERDRTLIAGDAFSTVKPESLVSVLSQEPEISGPPKYLTVDWEEAERSVARLRQLDPRLALPSHGQPMTGEELRSHLDLLVQHFDDIAVPDQGRFVEGP